MAVDAKTVNMEALPRISEFSRFRRVFFSRPLVAIGMVIMVVIILVAIFAPVLAPYEPNSPDLANTLAQPSKTHLLGTDAIGRDTLSRVLYGARTSLIIGISVVFISAVIGGVLGMLAGYFGGWVYIIIMRLIDALMTFPMVLLSLVISALLGGGMKNLMVALTVGMISGYARLMCGQVMSIRENDYVMAERSIGASSFRIMARHVFPNSFAPYIVLMTMALGGVVLAEAGLSYLGVGISPPTAAWGSMVNDGQQYLTSNPMLAFAPGFALMLVVFAFNMIGDGLRDALDPRLRGTL
jgi:peptide/nickel transport system permease protein